MQVHHYGIDVSHLEASVEFYQTFFHLKVIERMSFMDEKIVFLAGDGLCIELIEGSDGRPPASAHLAFLVNDLGQLMNELGNRGFVPAEGPYRIKKDWKSAFYKGPDGEMIEFMEMKAI